VREGSPQPVLTAANQEWAVDFAHDTLANGSGLPNLFLTPLVVPCAHACPVRVEFWVRILSSKPRPSLFINLLDSPRTELLH